MSAANYSNLSACFFGMAAERGDKPFLWAKRDGAWVGINWREGAMIVSRLARGLRAHGIEPGDRVALVSENRPEWVLADLAILTAGAVTVPAYTTNTVDDHRHILSNSGAKAVFVSNPTLADPLLRACAAEHMFKIFTLEPWERAPSGFEVVQYEQLQSDGAAQPDHVQEWSAKAGRDDLACIIHTSGTSGSPKGVMLSHGNVLHASAAAEEILVMMGRVEERFLSFLPMSHAYEYSCGRFLAIGIGAETYYAEGADALARNMVEVQPTVIACVPRLMEVLYGRVASGLKTMSPLRRKLFDAAVRIGTQRYDDPSKLSLLDRLIDPILDKLVRKKVAARFGGRLRALVSGGAPMNVEIGRFFHALGLPVFQGYGQTEASPLIACNRPGMIRLDTVGPAIPGVEVRIAEDGEILVRGPNLMLGYWRDEEATAAARRDGWLHTGDIGELDSLGRLKITDRKKDMIVVSGGDNISPAKVEGVLSLEPEIGQIMVYGDKHPYLVALVVPDEAFVKSQTDAGIGGDALVEAVERSIDQAIDRANAKLSQLERVRRFAVVMEPFSVANGMMTPTMKIRRHVVKTLFGAQLEALYERKRG